MKKVQDKKNRGKIWLIVGVVSIVLSGGCLGLRAFLNREIVETETIVAIQDGEQFAKIFRKYIRGRLKATELFGWKFREESDEEILAELAEIKDCFSGVSRDIATNYEQTEIEEVAEIMKSDAAIYLKEVREIRQIMTNEGDGPDKQVELLKKIDENEEKLLSRIYTAESAFPDGDSDLNRKGVLIFQGEMMLEVGGGVMNVFIGDAEKKVVAISTDDYSGVVKTINAEKAFGLLNNEIVRIGAGLKKELAERRLKIITISEDKIEKRSIGLIGETTYSLSPKLKEQGIYGLD